MTRLFLIFIAALALVHGNQARAETVFCTEIASLPYTISTPGAYCLQKDLSLRTTAPAAIAINASGVVLDCNHHELTRYSPSTTSYGVLGSKKRRVKVQNCAFNLFPTGIALVNAETSEIRGNEVTGAGLGILATGNSIDIIDNVVGAIYGTVNGAHQGILVGTAYTGQSDSAIRIIGNKLSYLRSLGIGVEGSNPVLIEGNFIQTAGNTDPRYGIWVHEGGSLPTQPVGGFALIRQNYIFMGQGTGVEVSDAWGSAALCSENYIRASTATNRCDTDSRPNTVLVR